MSRFVGFEFLRLHARGELPFAFAVPGGIGDVVVAIGALVVALPCVELRTRAQRTAFTVWNVIGLADIVGVVFTAARIFLHEPGSMAPLARLPLVMLPLYVVPIVVLAHVVNAARVRTAAASSARLEPRPE